MEESNKMKIEYELTDGRKIEAGTMFCIGRNYAAHAKEMGNLIPAEPVVFLKPAQAYVPDGSRVPLPGYSENVHHEVELVVLIGRDCADVAEENALDYVSGYAVGVDLTLRDVQKEATEKGKPWAVAKGFRHSAPISRFVPASLLERGKQDFELELSVNGEVRQHGNTADMERSVPELVSYLSRVFTLRAGDVIFTGTPEGVGRIIKGDEITAELKGLAKLSFEAE